MRESLEFLLKVWGHTCKQGETVFLCTKHASTRKWEEHSFKINGENEDRLKEFFEEYPAEKYDIYFCPTAFTKGVRKKRWVSPLNILWSDIDDGTAKLKPSLLWESSPGRLQGLWFMHGERILAADGESLNKALTYYMGDADSSGWDITQVLRIPGTINHKYESMPVVRVIEENDTRYTSAKIARTIGYNMDVPTPKVDSSTASGKSFNEVYSKYRKKIPIKVKQLLTQKNIPAKGSRSDTLWYMNNQLLECGVTPDEIKVLIRHSVWNKFKGREDEEYRLQKEVEHVIEEKIVTQKEEDIEEAIDEELSTDLEIQSFYGLMSSVAPSPGWLVEGWWLNKSHGIVAGEPKSFKSTLALDLAISVASGNPFLGKHEVVNPGPVVYIQNENAQWIMKDRVSKIAVSRGVVGKVEIHDEKRASITWPQDIPFYMVNQQSFLLTDPMHQQLLEKIIQQYEPAFVVLDPLYLMFDGDINSAKELNPVLSWMLEMRIKYDCGIMLVHHSNKGGDNKRGGQRMLGSTTLHGWTESAWYIKNDISEDEEEHTGDINQAKAQADVTVEREFRGAGLHPHADLTITMGEIGTDEYGVESKVHVKKAEAKTKQDPLLAEKEVLRLVKYTAHTEKELKDKTGFNAATITKAVDYLAEKNKVTRKNDQVHKVEEK